MRSLRDIKIQARRDLHFHAQVPALYISPTGKAAKLVTVRLHSKNAKIGNLVSDKTFAERTEVVPRVVFLRNQISEPKQKAIISFAQGEAYRVVSVEPLDLITVTAVCVRIPVEDTKLLPFPLPNAEGYDPNDPQAPEEGGGTTPIGESGRIQIPFPVATTDWSFTHNLGYFPDVMTLDQNGEEFLPNVEMIDLNTIRITVIPASPGLLILR